MLRSRLSTQQCTFPTLPLSFAPRGKPTELISSKSLRGQSRFQTPRDSTPCRANFFDTLFAGSNKNAGSASEEATELVNELLQIIKKKRKGNKPYVGTDDRIEEIIGELQVLKVTRNPARSPLLFGDYDAGFCTRVIAPPGSFNFRVCFDKSLDVVQSIDLMNLGLFKGSAKRYCTMKITGPNTFTLDFVRTERDKGPFGGTIVEQLGNESRNFEIAYLDERILVVFAFSNKPDEESIIQLFIRSQRTTPEPEVKKKIKSDISMGGVISKRSRKVSGATEAEKKYSRDVEAQKDKAKEREAEKKAREEAIRLQKEKAAADKEAALQLKAQIQASVDAFGMQLKEAQANKKEAATALKNFERENSNVLKEAIVCRKKIEGFGAEVADLAEEISDMVDQEQQTSTELKDCRRQLVELERKLAVL